MPRPKKCRRVGFIPKCLRFLPDGGENETLEEIVIRMEEIEAIRLSDFEGLEQNDCAARMAISRGTFQRIINAARQKISDALINGKTIRIEGGCYKREHCTLICKCCGHQWEHISKEAGGQVEEKCSSCDSKNLECGEKNGACKKQCRKFNIKHNDII